MTLIEATPKYYRLRYAGRGLRATVAVDGSDSGVASSEAVRMSESSRGVTHADAA